MAFHLSPRRREEQTTLNGPQLATEPNPPGRAVYWLDVNCVHHECAKWNLIMKDYVHIRSHKAPVKLNNDEFVPLSPSLKASIQTFYDPFCFRYSKP